MDLKIVIYFDSLNDFAIHFPELIWPSLDNFHLEVENLPSNFL